MTEQTTSGSIAPLFDQFFDQLKTTHPKLDSELLIKIMLFEKNLKEYVGPDLPHVHLDVVYEKGVDLKQKQEEGRDKFPIEVTTNKWGDGVIFSGLMGIRHVEKICVDPQIVKVTGKATPRHN
ncbi:MAG: hypothetical protein HN756_04200 [Nitrosopumilus sp.]|jgi:hypothetical protein|nr:hypothetical protein [Nitrosopumilus sp.]|tara:strand:- start:95 stop:463 length:369 start_codon:yes stop_codon:yes gene_type:complete